MEVSFPQLRSRVTRHLFAILLLLSLVVTASAQSDEPALHAILVDNSGSLRTQFDRVLTLGTAVVQGVHKQGPISIFSFEDPGGSLANEPPPLIVAHTIWNSDPVILSKYVDSLNLERGQTSLLDAIHSMVKHINAKAEQNKTPSVRKILVLITDGEDRKSKIKEKELLAELQQQTIKVYAIGLVQELVNERGLMRGNPRQNAIKFLTNITKDTGGRALFPKTNGEDVNVLIQSLFAAPQ